MHSYARVARSEGYGFSNPSHIDHRPLVVRLVHATSCRSVYADGVQPRLVPRVHHDTPSADLERDPLLHRLDGDSWPRRGRSWPLG